MAVDGDLGVFVTTYFPRNGESADRFTEKHCREVLAGAVGEQLDPQIIEVAAWQPYEQVADQVHCGRAFLVGDCAHTMPPFKAGGANTAIQSAHNLAWKIAAVVHGTAGPALLDTYHAERHPIGRFSARQSLTGPTIALLPLGDDPPQLPADEECSMFELLISYRYRSAAVVTDDRSVSAGIELVQELRGQPGTRVPHVWVGRDVSTLDLVGHGFALLTDEERWRAAAAAASAALGVSIAVHCVGDDKWLAATEVGPGGALLVRPDDFVGWRADELPVDAEGQLRQALSTILCR